MAIQKANRDKANYILCKKIGGTMQWRAAVKAAMKDNNILG